jgi:hypothetical protein
MYRILVLMAVVLFTGTVLVQSQDPAPEQPPAARQPPVPPGSREREVPVRPQRPFQPPVQAPDPTPAAVPRTPRFEAFQPLDIEKVPVVVELDLVLAQWAPGTEAERKEISESLVGDAKAVAARLAKLQLEGKFAAVENLSISTLNGRAAMVRMGQSRPYVTNVNSTTFGVSNGVTLMDVGTLANVLPQVFENDNVLLQVRFEKSNIETSDDLPVLLETKDGKKVHSAMTTRFSCDTTMRLANGKTAIAAGTSSKSDQHLLLITTKVTQ